MSNEHSESKGNLVKIGVAGFIVGTAGYLISNLYHKRRYNSIIKKKQEELKNKKDILYNRLVDLKTPLNNMEVITSLKLKDLIEELELGKYTPVEVLQAFQAKALLMDRDYNFITDFNPNSEIDASFSMSKKGLLKGIPISVKDMIYVKDCDCTYGMPSLCFKPAVQDCTLINSLRIQGVVPFVMTNMSQTGKSIESSNPVFGQTLNPFNKERTCGGSSGGEGAIIASGASIIGLGSDIGGSIRIPSSYCGIFGLKPTSSRLTHRHTIRTFPTQNFITFSFGPMARRFDDLLLFFKAMACGDLYHQDPYCPPLCFNEKIFLKKRALRIGFYVNLGENQVVPVPSVVRGVNLAKNALESAGHQLLQFSIPNVDKAVSELYMNCLFTDGGYGLVNKFVNRNPVDSSMSLMLKIIKMPNILKRILSYLIYPFNKNYSFLLYAMAGIPSIYNLWELKDKIDSYKEEVLTKWESEKLDGIICPVLPITAPPCRTSHSVIEIIGYTAIYNVLDYPAGSVPVTYVEEDDITELLTTYPKDTYIQRQIIDLQKGSLGMPVGVQCVALPWREELCLRIMRDIDVNL